MAVAIHPRREQAASLSELVAIKHTAVQRERTAHTERTKFWPTAGVSTG